MTDNEIEKEIQEKVLTAPRVTLEDIEANILFEKCITADRALGEYYTKTLPEAYVVDDALSCLTFCVLVLRNGFTVTGKSACASPENFDAELGRKIARQDAVNQMWALMGYALKQQLFEQSTKQD